MPLTNVPSGVSRYQYGEYAYVRFVTDPAPPAFEYRYSVYAVTRAKYLSVDGFTADVLTSAEYFEPTEIELPDGRFIFEAKINTTDFATNDILLVTMEEWEVVADPDPDVLVASYEVFVEVGEALIADTSITAQVFGFLRDAHGDFIKNVPVTFTVLNKGGYFDNTPVTTLNATTLTNGQGKFDIQLNRNYDYIMAIEHLNYRKRIKLSSLPSEFHVVEVDVGTGLGC